MGLLNCGTEHCVLPTGHSGYCTNKNGGSIVSLLRSQGRTVHNERSPVDHPPHYTSHPSGIECITIVEHMPFNVGNAIKYLWRSGLKENTPTEQDLDKAIWYIQREKERLKTLASDLTVKTDA